MTEQELLFHRIAQSIPGAIESKMMGEKCIKSANRKVGVFFYQDEMVFRLPDEHFDRAFNLKGAKYFDPMEGQPFKNWVQVPFEHSHLYSEFAEIALQFVSELPSKKKK